MEKCHYMAKLKNEEQLKVTYQIQNENEKALQLTVYIYFLFVPVC